MPRAKKNPVPTLGDQRPGLHQHLPSETTTHDAAHSNTARVLIAEQNPGHVESITRVLTDDNRSYQIDSAFSGALAIQNLWRYGYDLLILSHQPPEIDSLEILKSLRELEARPVVLVLFESELDRLASQAQELGAAEYLVKFKGFLSALPFVARSLLQQKKSDVHGIAAHAQTSSPDAHAKMRGTFHVDHRGRFIQADALVTAITSYTSAELQQLTLMDLVPKENEWQFHLWLHEIGTGDERSQRPFSSALVGKYGQQPYVTLQLQPEHDRQGKLLRYWGTMAPASRPGENGSLEVAHLDEMKIVEDLLELASQSQDQPMGIVLERMAQLAGRSFGFRRATLALLDRREQVYFKHTLVGFLGELSKQRSHREVPMEVVERVFAHRFRVKAVYYQQDQRQAMEMASPILPERRTQFRRPNDEWHPRDLVMINLCLQPENSFGYIALDDPANGLLPRHELFHGLEIFSRVASMAMQSYFRMTDLGRQSRRLRQVMATSNIFKLHLSLNQILREMVWSIKISLEFGLVALALISKRSGKLEIKAVACDDKIKTAQLMDLQFSLEEVAQELRSRHVVGKSFMIPVVTSELVRIKQIYHEMAQNPGASDWPRDGLLLVPLRGRDRTIFGFMMLDDPVHAASPNEETAGNLEMLANQIAVAIENRIIYLQAKNKIGRFAHDIQEAESVEFRSGEGGKRSWKKWFW